MPPPYLFFFWGGGQFIRTRYIRGGARGSSLARRDETRHMLSRVSRGTGPPRQRDKNNSILDEFPEKKASFGRQSTVNFMYSNVMYSNVCMCSNVQ